MQAHHWLLPQQTSHSDSQFVHYLSTGSHRSPYSLPLVKSFSLVTFLPHSKLTIPIPTDPSNNTFILPLAGRVKVNGNVCLDVCTPHAQSLRAGDEDSKEPTKCLYMVLSKEHSQSHAAIRRIEQESTIEIKQELLYLLKGSLTVLGVCTIKNSSANVEPIPLLLATAATKVTLSAGSEVVTVSTV